jgi:2,4-didehydro-3-deoxy-L-rhamnonate hydrolase
LPLIYDDWHQFAAWAATVDLSAATPFCMTALEAPSPCPRQVFAIGLNYRDHAAEAGAAVPEQPTMLFTKWSSCLSGPVSTVQLPPTAETDWEVELVAVVGSIIHRIGEEHVWDHIAGVTVGQDLTDRSLQNLGPTPQFSIGKSMPGFGPTGPWLVTLDDVADPDDLELGCLINGELDAEGPHQRTRVLGTHAGFVAGASSDPDARRPGLYRYPGGGRTGPHAAALPAGR